MYPINGAVLSSLLCPLKPIFAQPVSFQRSPHFNQIINMQHKVVPFTKKIKK